MMELKITHGGQDSGGREMNGNTKEEILNYMIGNTEHFQADADWKYFTTYYVARELKISRNLASSYLNALVKEGELVKVIGRPVYFFHLRTIERVCHVRIPHNEFEFPEDFRSLLDNRPEDAKGGVIGGDMSLSYCVSQCQSAVKYPGPGVPVLLWGEAGTGKKYLARYLYRYAVANHSIPEGAPFLSLECTEQAAGALEDLRQLFGSRRPGETNKTGQTGLIQGAGNGMLFVNNLHLMSGKAQERLARYLEEAASDSRMAPVKFIFACGENPSGCLDKSLLEQIPVVSFVPPLRERSAAEKKLFVTHFFKEEEQHLGCRIAVSGRTYRSLMRYPFDGNLSQLKSFIKVTCANAFLKSAADGEMQIHLYQLPSELISSVETDEEGPDEQNMLYIADLSLFEEENSDYLIPFLQQMLDIFGQYAKGDISMEELIRTGTHCLNEFYDFIVFERKYSNSKIKALEEIVGRVLDSVSRRHSIFLPANCEFVVARLIYVMTGDSAGLRRWSDGHIGRIQEFLKVLESEYQVETAMAREIRRRLEELLDVGLSEVTLIFLILNIRFYNRKTAGADLTGLVIAHGYSAASSIADSVNKLLDKHVLSSFDMPLNTDINDIIPKIKAGLQSGVIGRNLIILVDMGSLEELGKIICEYFPVNIGVVNNISTKVALAIGEGIANGGKIQEILDRACEESRIEYHLYNNLSKEPAILFASESGAPMTDRVLRIFRDSFPKNLRIRLQTVDQESLLQPDWDSLYARYDILFISGTMDPHVPDIPYIALEDIIASDAMGYMNRLLGKYMSPEELSVFNEKLLKNFTLQNVIQYLTILNADRLLEVIREAVGQLQRRMNCKFSVKTIIGIYIHVCCLVERLVTKTPIAAYENLEEFTRENQEFIRLLTDSFHVITEQYNVELPVSEIAYLYDYVKNDANVRTRETQ